jgi:hypothetical protein
MVYTKELIMNIGISVPLPAYTPTATLSSALSLTPPFMGQIGTMIAALHPDDQR